MHTYILTMYIHTCVYVHIYVHTYTINRLYTYTIYVTKFAKRGLIHTSACVTLKRHNFIYK